LVAGLEQRLGLQISSDEAGFIALHLARIALAVENPTGTSSPTTREKQ